MSMSSKFIVSMVLGLGFIAWLALFAYVSSITTRQVVRMLVKMQPAKKLYACECDRAMRRWQDCACRRNSTFRGL